MAQQDSTSSQVPQSRPAYRLRFWSSIKPQTIPERWQVACPECGQLMPEGDCYNLRCIIGLHNVQEAVHRDMPEDCTWMQGGAVVSSEEAAPAASPSPASPEVAA